MTRPQSAKGIGFAPIPTSFFSLTSAAGLVNVGEFIGHLLTLARPTTGHFFWLDLPRVSAHS